MPGTKAVLTEGNLNTCRKARLTFDCLGTALHCKGFQFCYKILLQICTVHPASPAETTFLLFGVLTASSLRRTDLKPPVRNERFPKPRIRDSAWKGASRWCCCTATQDFLSSSLQIATLGAFTFDPD